jgi:hypothetical protein
MPQTTAPIEERHLVLIAAAVSAVCGENARILGIAPKEAPERNDWSHTGRVQIHGSHRPAQEPGPLRSLVNRDTGVTTK